MWPAPPARARRDAGGRDIVDSLRREQFLIFTAAFLRSLATGMTGVLLALHLNAIGWDLRQTGLLVSCGLAGHAAATLAVSFFAERTGRRRMLAVMAALAALGWLALAASPHFRAAHAALYAAAFAGLINGLGRDRGPAFALEPALLAEVTSAGQRTFGIAWYSLVLDAGLAIGSLGAAAPYLLRRALGWETLEAFQFAWLVCALLSLAALTLYFFLSPRVEARRGQGTAPGRVPRETRRRVIHLALLTGMDSLGGGFLSSALVSFWFFERFQAGEGALGLLFFAARVLNAGSHLAAAWLARRIGLLNTMVFTHLPSSVFLLAVPFAPSLGWAVALFLAREGLVEMDVPTRQSYILAVVPAEQRAFASGVTTFTRNVAYAAAPAFAGWAMRAVSAASPIFFGAGIKIFYDLLLYFSFRRVRPPEESASGGSQARRGQRDG
jgi:MFS family permease